MIHFDRNLLDRASPDRTLTVIGLGLVGTLIALVAFGMDRMPMDALSGALTLLVLVLVSVPILQWVARKEGDRDLAPMLLWALAAKVVFTLLRHYVITVVYANNADAGVYSDGGAYLSERLRSGILSLNIPDLAARGVETERIAQVVGLVYTVTGVSRYSAAFVFAFISFAGQVLMWRAFRQAVPEGDHRRYGLLVLFLPSLLFWPSSIGKEALMLGCIGIVSYGAAQVFRDRVRVGGIVTFLTGVTGLFMIRPHMALIAIVALGGASLVGTLSSMQRSASMRSLAVRVIALLVLVAAAGVATSGLARFFSDGKGDDETGVSSVLNRTTEQTKTGGSEFQPVAVTNPANVPAAIVTVLVRPFPWEAHNVNGVIASAEGVLFVVLFVSGRRRVITWVRTAPKRPYLIFAAVYAFVFIVAFSYIGNFGILARQRTQMLPLLLTMIAMHPAPRQKLSLLGFRPDRPGKGSVVACSDEDTASGDPAVGADDTADIVPVVKQLLGQGHSNPS